MNPCFDPHKFYSRREGLKAARFIVDFVAECLAARTIRFDESTIVFGEREVPFKPEEYVQLAQRAIDESIAKCNGGEIGGRN